MALTAKTFPRRPTPNPDSSGLNMHGVGVAREVSFKALLGGVEIPGLKSFTKDEAPYSAGSSLSMVFHMDDSFDVHLISQEVLPLTARLETTVKINGADAFPDKEEFEGVVDNIEEDYNAATITISARSYAQILLNEKINEVFTSKASQAKTTSQVVKDMVAKYGKGLKAVVDDFKTPVGRFFKDKAVKVTTNLPVWDLLTNFANEDHADLYVKGQTLYYVKKPVDKAVDITQLNGHPANFSYAWMKNILKLSIRHAPMFSHDVTVTVNSYNARTGKTFTGKSNMSALKIAAVATALETDKVTATSLSAKSDAKFSKRKPGKVTGTAAAARIGNKENYAFNVPNLSQEDCDRVAARIMADISKKEFIVNMTVLGQPNFNPRQYIKLSGTRSKRTDQVYAIKNIHTSFGMPDSGGQAQGYLTQFTLVNHAVQTTGTNLGL